MRSTPSLDTEQLLAHAKGLRALARHLVGDAHLAEDVVQDALLAVVRRPPAADVPLGPWLVGVVRNLAKMSHRGRARRDHHERLTAAPSLTEPAEAAVARAETLRLLVDAVLALPEPFRAAVAMRYIDGLAPAEIARRIGIPAATVRTRVHRGIEILRDRLDRDHRERGAWVLLFTGRRMLPRARDSVSPVAASSAVVAGGALVIKKAHAVAAVLLLLLAGWVATRSHNLPSDLSQRREPVAAGARAVDPPRAARTLAEAPPVTPPAPPDTRARLTGRVVDDAGAAIAGATILAQPMIEAAAPPIATSATTKSAEDGRFEVRPPDVAGLFRLFADAPGFGTAAADNVREGIEVTITLRAPLSVTGRVVNLDANPIPGARVRWIGGVERSAVILRETHAGPDGTYRLTGIPTRTFGTYTVNQESSNIVAEAEGFAPLTVHWTPGGGADRLDLRLVRGATLDGRVVDAESGRPIANAHVVAWTTERSEGPSEAGGGVAVRRGPGVLAEVRTDTDGRFRVEHVPTSGFHALRGAGSGRRGQLVGYVGAFVQGYAPGDDEIPVRDDGAAIDATIRLWPSATVEGKVVDRAGAPVSGLRVDAWSKDRQGGWLVGPIEGAPPHHVVTDATGSYRLESVCASRETPSTVRISAESTNLRSAFPTGGVKRPSVEVTLRAGETVRAPDLVYDPQIPRVVLLVADSAGRPVWGASGRVNSGPFGATSDCVSGRDGRIEQIVSEYSLKDAKAVDITVRAPGFRPTVTPPIVPSVDEPPEVPVTLLPGHAVSGRVLRADGSPGSHLSITIRNGNIATDVLFPKTGDAGLKWDDPSLPQLKDYGTFMTSNDGTFEAHDLPEGPYTLRVMGDSAWKIIEHVATDARDVAIEVPALPPAVPNGSLEVLFQDAATGSPVAHPSAWLARERGWSQGTWVDPVADPTPGVLRWPDLPVGDWTLAPSVVGFEAQEWRAVTVKSGETTRLTIKLRAGATVRGTVTAGDGVVLEELNICLLPNDGRRGVTAVLKADHTYEVRTVPRGRYHALVSRPNPGEAQYAIEGLNDLDVPAEGGVLQMDLRVVRAATIGFQVEGTTEIRTCGRYVVRDLQGTEVVAGALMGVGIGHAAFVPPGTYDVTVTVDGRDPATKRVVLQAGGKESLKF